MPAVNGVGKPCAGEPHARFDGRGLETEHRSDQGHGDKGHQGKPCGHQRLRDLPSILVTAPALDPTRNVVWRGCRYAKVPVLQGIIGLLYGSITWLEGTSQVKSIAVCSRGPSRRRGISAPTRRSSRPTKTPAAAPPTAAAGPPMRPMAAPATPPAISAPLCTSSVVSSRLLSSCAGPLAVTTSSVYHFAPASNAVLTASTPVASSQVLSRIFRVVSVAQFQRFRRSRPFLTRVRFPAAPQIWHLIVLIQTFGVICG
jgi:hypothetical protein